MICHDCGNVIDCPHCDAHMTLHRQPPHMHCHHCDYPAAQSPGNVLPARVTGCNLPAREQKGQSSLLNNLFPGFNPVLRIDRDSTRKKDRLWLQMLEKIQEPAEPSILAGHSNAGKRPSFSQCNPGGHHQCRFRTIQCRLSRAGAHRSADYAGGGPGGPGP